MMSWFPGDGGSTDLRFVHQVEPRDLTAAELAAVDSYWENEAVARGWFDGTVLRCLGVELVGSILTVRFSPCKYRLVAAARADSDLARRIHPLAVSGVLTTGATGDERVLVGRRPRNVTQFPGAWELVASGGLSAEDVRPDGELDYGSRLLSEIEEELGLGAPVEPTFMSPLGLVLDDGTVEVVVWMQVAADLSLRGGNGEDRYTDVQWIPIAELERFRAEHSKEMVPLSSWLAGLIASQGLGRIARVS